MFEIIQRIFIRGSRLLIYRAVCNRQIFALTAKEGGNVENAGAIFYRQNLHFHRP
ncbi:hypothetical protein Q9L42_018015 [Methylomarinum sp. Ch1-1]|uniref:Uncharacterized protein n=1 Tax=Methylomarinum roseum TaxID=3067653 RepID=A0AAU7NTH8_9GAMM|nr:hypothetical protein [Methylomarinum sp. Ch1-1]MDP4519751.1 hypothetical protein [Methylomarinum sp. Ch1-1]